MTARMYYDNDAESSGQWRRGAPPWTSESKVRECGSGALEPREARVR
jgi:hypothetical protein